jgi:hypothetical protein
MSRLNRLSVTPLAALSLVALLGGCGITGNFRADPGFAAFHSPGYAETHRQFALSLGPLPLMLARKITSGDPELAAMLDGVKAVRVYVYDVDGDREQVGKRLESAWNGLTERGWDSVVAVREDGGLASMLVRFDERAQVQGVAVMAQDVDEVVFVNVIGDIRPQTFSALMAQFDIEFPSLYVEESSCADCSARRAGAAFSY